MHSPKNLNLVIQAILKAQKQAPHSSTVELNVCSENKLNAVPEAELSKILYDLECKEWVINSRTVPSSSTPQKESSLTIKIREDLGNWYSAYLLRIKRKLQNLSPNMVKRLLYLSDEIKKKFQEKCSPGLWIYVGDENYEDCLKFLYDQNILIDYTNTYEDDPEPYTRLGFTIQATLNVTKFIKFYSQIEKFKRRLERNSATLSTNQQNGYNIECDAFSGQIKLNGKVLAKPNFNSGNEKFFAYLYEHPNQNIPIKELATRVGIEVSKLNLYKRLENLGFKGNLRQAFFKISKQAILFRNPVKKDDFDKLSIPPLRIPKKSPVTNHS